jgi:hypothetical protein
MGGGGLDGLWANAAGAAAREPARIADLIMRFFRNVKESFAFNAISLRAFRSVGTMRATPS